MGICESYTSLESSTGVHLCKAVNAGHIRYSSCIKPNTPSTSPSLTTVTRDPKKEVPRDANVGEPVTQGYEVQLNVFGVSFPEIS
jgi:hypothetical protein